MVNEKARSVWIFSPWSINHAKAQNIRMVPKSDPAFGGILKIATTHFVRGLCLERETGIEPATFSLGSWRSTAELLPHGGNNQKRIDSLMHVKYNKCDARFKKWVFKTKRVIDFLIFFLAVFIVLLTILIQRFIVFKSAVQYFRCHQFVVASSSFH